MSFVRAIKPAGRVANVPDVGGSSGSDKKARRVVIFVLGTQRSGTSAITRFLSLCGGSLPPGMLGADAGNPRGNWEPRKAIAINEAILHRQHSAWFDPSLRLREEGTFTAKEKAVCIGKIKRYLDTLSAESFLVIKEPRITVLSDLWFEAARQARFDIAVVIAARHPQEVISSVTKSWNIPPELSSALWLKYSLLAERDTREVPRVFVEYANLLEDWRTEAKRISTALPLDLNIKDEGEIDEFLTPDLRRQNYSGAVTERFGTDWISTVHNALRAAGRDESVDWSTLNRVFESYRASEHDFRTASEDFRRRSGNLRSQILRPAITKPMIELAAMANRRKGTWA